MFRGYYKRKITDDVEINLMPFINFLVVLIPVLMLSAEFSETSILDTHATRSGVNEDSVSSTTSANHHGLVICLSDSAITIASDDGVLAGLPCTARHLPAERLSVALSSIRTAAPGTGDRIVIASDRQVRYQRLIDVMDLAKKSGFGDISIARLRG